MTVLVLDHPATAAFPYQRWLTDPVIATTRSGDEPARWRAAGLRVARVAGPHDSARFDWAACRLGEEAGVSAVVALEPSELTRAAAIGAHLGVARLDRATTTALVDLVSLRDRWRDRGIDTVRYGPSGKPADLVHFVQGEKRLAELRGRGATIRLRRRRRPPWPVLCEVSTWAQLRQAARHTESVGQEVMQSLAIEESPRGVRVCLVDRGAGLVIAGEQAPGAVLPVALSAVAAAGVPAGWPLSLTVVVTPDGALLAEDLVVGADDPAGYRAWARAQAGQAGRASA
jgi:hypothetical protein